MTREALLPISSQNLRLLNAGFRRNRHGEYGTVAKIINLGGYIRCRRLHKLALSSVGLRWTCTRRRHLSLCCCQRAMFSYSIATTQHAMHQLLDLKIKGKQAISRLLVP